MLQASRVHLKASPGHKLEVLQEIEFLRNKLRTPLIYSTMRNIKQISRNKRVSKHWEKPWRVWAFILARNKIRFNNCKETIQVQPERHSWTLIGQIDLETAKWGPTITRAKLAIYRCQTIRWCLKITIWRFSIIRKMQGKRTFPQTWKKKESHKRRMIKTTILPSTKSR